MMKIVRRSTQAFVVSLMICAAVLLLLVSLGSAQQHAAAHVIKSVVPDNPSPHPAPEQPIPYSHKQHLAFGLQCKQCHTNPEPGKLMTFPATTVCMQCHVTIAKEKPAIQKLAEYSKTDQPIPWVRIYKVLPGVEWSHRTHVEAGVKCETCHSKVSEISQMSEVTSVVTMYSCLSCHQANQAKTACETCHKH